MEPHVLLAKFHSLLARAPDFAGYSPVSSDYHTWLAQAHALVSRWNKMEASSIQIASDFLVMPANRDYNVEKIFGSLYRAIADLELQHPDNTDQAFGPGAVYDFFKALNEITSSATHSLLIVDPYIDDEVFDTYLPSLQQSINIRLLVGKCSGKINHAAKKYIAQYGVALEVRTTANIHDRVIFVDGNVCWVVGQSVKDAAKSKPTYIAPLSPDVCTLKLADYELIWVSANGL
jgi:hypothetical protein